MIASNLTENEKVLVRNRDWLGVVQYGVNFFALEKWARFVELPNMMVYATMRGETYEDFLKTRRVPEMR